MSKSLRILPLAAALVLGACVGPGQDGDWNREPDRGPPTVSIRADRNADRLVPAARDMMERAGYEVARDRWADFELSVVLDDGPVNAIVDMALTRRGRVIAQAQGRAGGPRMLFDRRGVIQDAFDDCARKLQRDLPPYRGDRYGHSSRYDDERIDRSGRYNDERW